MRPRRSGSAGCPASPALRAARQGQAPARTAGFPAIPASLGCPRMVPVSNGECISTRCASVAQEPAGIHFEFFSIHMFAHRILAVIRTLQRLSTALCTNHPQLPAVTRGKPRTSSSGLSRRRPAAGLGPGARWWASVLAQAAVACHGCGNVHTLWDRAPHPPPSAGLAGGPGQRGDPGGGAVPGRAAIPAAGRSGPRGDPGGEAVPGGEAGPGGRRGPGDVPVPRAPATAMSPRVRNAAVNTIALSR